LSCDKNSPEYPFAALTVLYPFGKRAEQVPKETFDRSSDGKIVATIFFSADFLEEVGETHTNLLPILEHE